MSLFSEAGHERYVRAVPHAQAPAPAQLTLGDELRTTFAVLFGGWPVYLAAMAVAVFLALLFVVVSPQLYVASTHLLLEPKPKQVVSGGVVDNSMSTAVAGADILSIDSQIEVMTSGAVARELILSENLMEDAEFVPSNSILSRIRATFGSLLRGSSRSIPGVDPRYDGVLKEYYRRLKVKREANTYVVGITFKSEDSEKAARIANKIAQIYLEQTAAATVATTQTTAEAIEGRLEALRAAANDDAEAVEEYRRQNNLIGAENVLVAEQQLRELNNQLSLARVARVNAQTSLDNARAALASSSGAGGTAVVALDSSVLSQLQVNLATLEGEEARLRATLQSRHPSIMRINDQKAAIIAGMRAEMVRIVERFELAYQVALERETSIGRQVGDLESRRADLNDASVQLRELERKSQASQSVYQTFLTRSKEVWEQIGLPNDVARVIAPAYPPARPAEPKASLLVPAAAALGLIVGVVWVWLAWLMGMDAFPSRRRHA